VAEAARESRRRLRRALQAESGGEKPLDREALLSAIVAADPRAACVARRRKSRVSFSSGGTEMELGRESRAQTLAEASDAVKGKGIEALIVLSTQNLSHSAMKRQILISAASPVSLRFLAQAGLGEDKLRSASRKGGQLIVEVERVWAKKTLSVSEIEPEGALARRAIVQLFLQGSLHQKQKREAERRLSRRALAARLGKNSAFPFFVDCREPPALEDWLLGHLHEMGVERGGDLELLSPLDFLPQDVPAELAPTLDERFPLQVDLGDCLYEAHYDLEKNQVLLSIVRGHRKSPPPAQYLPRFEGLKLYAEAAGSFHLVRRG
jgi:hypothetical protein